MDPNIDLTINKWMVYDLRDNGTRPVLIREVTEGDGEYIAEVEACLEVQRVSRGKQPWWETQDPPIAAYIDCIGTHVSGHTATWRSYECKPHARVSALNRDDPVMSDWHKEALAGNIVGAEYVSWQVYSYTNDGTKIKWHHEYGLARAKERALELSKNRDARWVFIFAVFRRGGSSQLTFGNGHVAYVLEPGAELLMTDQHLCAWGYGFDGTCDDPDPDWVTWSVTVTPTNGPTETVCSRVVTLDDALACAKQEAETYERTTQIIASGTCHGAREWVAYEFWSRSPVMDDTQYFARITPFHWCAVIRGCGEPCGEPQLPLG